MNKTIIVALFGAAGTGKDTIQKEIAKQSPFLFHEIISSTTRPPREYEQNGVDYTFISDSISDNYLKNGEYLEYAEFRGWRYGTLKNSIRSDKINIGVFNISGVKQLMKLPNEEYLIIPIWVKCSDKTRLLRQLNREQDPDCEEICRRFATDQKDLDPQNIHFRCFAFYNENHIPEILVKEQLLPFLYESLLLEFVQGGYLDANEDGIIYSFGQNDIISPE